MKICSESMPILIQRCCSLVYQKFRLELIKAVHLNLQCSNNARTRHPIFFALLARAIKCLWTPTAFILCADLSAFGNFFLLHIYSRINRAASIQSRYLPARYSIYGGNSILCIFNFTDLWYSLAVWYVDRGTWPVEPRNGARCLLCMCAFGAYTARRSKWAKIVAH